MRDIEDRLVGFVPRVVVVMFPWSHFCVVFGVREEVMVYTGLDIEEELMLPRLRRQRS
jgi:hypothetical protein